MERGEESMSRDLQQKSTSRLDNVQLKQKIIHLQAELSRYKDIVVKYQNNYHYNQLDELNNEITDLKNSLADKEKECAELKNVKDEIEANVKGLIEKSSGFNDTNVELTAQIKSLTEEHEGVKEENELLKIENSNLQKTIETQEEEVKKLKELVEVHGTEKEKDQFEGKRSSVHVKGGGDTTDSWFLRSIKQQNKNN